MPQRASDGTCRSDAGSPMGRASSGGGADAALRSAMASAAPDIGGRSNVITTFQ